MVPPNQRKHAFRRPSAHPNLPKRMVRRFGSLRCLRAFKTRVSDVLRASEPLEISVSDVFHAFTISETRVGDAFGVFVFMVPLVIFVPLGTAFRNIQKAILSHQSNLKLLQLISAPHSSLPIHFESCVRNVVRHFPSPGLRMLIFWLPKLKDTFGASRTLARKL